jgi:antitoxin component YwqK of YwqJK toxin-antitoxin module
MLPVVVSNLIVILLLAGYRVLWLGRYGTHNIDGALTRIQGRVVGERHEAVLQRAESGDLFRRPFEVEAGDGTRCRVDPRSAWLSLVGRTVHGGDIVTVVGTPALLSRPEALYREASQVPGLRALRVAPGAWPELLLLRLASAFSALLFIGALALPPLVGTRPELGGQAWVEPSPPAPHLPCPPGTHQAGERVEYWCETATGTREGPKVSYWEYSLSARQLRETGLYLAGEKDGFWITYDGQGRLQRHATFARGAAVGCRQTWEAGQPRASECFAGGFLEGPSALWDQGGQLRERGSYRHGEKHGRWEVWSDEGILLREGEYRDGQRHGLWRFWNTDGGRAARGHYHRGEHDGLWRWWHDTQHLAGHGRYRRGVKEGRWEAFYPSGRRAAAARYRRGEPTAAPKVWREEPRPAQRARYTSPEESDPFRVSAAPRGGEPIFRLGTGLHGPSHMWNSPALATGTCSAPLI